ncbi:MAG TPA: ABC transporter ATP-binding protein, partial [Bacteroidales bacterium]|nr:ABC transporter ATP-binding protein [Bacteroidales bacterium]
MIALRNISKTYPGFSLRNVNLEIDQSDYFVLLGMSGAGKTMLLDIIAGFIVPDTGSIWVNNNNITRVPIQKRNIAMVFHDAALFPHLSVRQNIAYPLRRRKNSSRKVEELAELVQAKHLLARYPSDLSAGEKQRISLARALSVAPDVLLLDEPLASLDVPTRSHLRSILRNIHAAGTRIVHVTHDYEEALLLANK